MLKTRRIIGAVLIGLVLISILAVPVVAATYYADVSMNNTSVTDYEMLPLMCGLPTIYLAANGYISETGLDTLVESGACPHMLSDDKLLYARAAPAGAGSLVEFTTGNTALSAFHILTGYNGYITVLDNAQLELGNTFVIEQKGYVDTTFLADKNLIYKDDAIRVYVSAAGDITATIAVTTTSATFHPDPHVEVTSVDGYVQEGTDTNNWATIVGAAGDSASDADAATHFAAIWSAAAADTWTQLRRSIFLFDTSGLPDGATITSATFSVYGTAKGDTFVPAIAPDLNVYASTPAGDVALVGTDYAQIGAVAFCDTPITYAGYDTAGYNDFVLNAAGLAAIDDTGISKFGLRNANYDVAVNTPTWSASKEARFLGAYADQGGTTQDPKLVVAYVATPTVSVTATGITSGVRTVKVTADGVNLLIQVYDEDDALIDDGTMALGGATVGDNGNNWIINQTNVMPYMEYLKITSPVGGSSEKLYYQPVDYIHGQAYTTGTATFNNASVDVVGLGTAWTSEMEGSMIWSDTDLISHIVSSVTDTTNLVLTVVYSGAGGGGHNYTMAPRLPDRDTGDGYQDGAITWGVNATGVSVYIGAFTPVISVVGEVTPPPDVGPEISTDEGAMYPDEEAMEGTTLPWLYPIVSDVSQRTKTPIVLIWWLMCAVYVLVFMAAIHRFVPNLLLTGVSGIVALGTCVGMAFLPAWFIILAVLFIIGLIVMERSPAI